MNCPPAAKSVVIDTTFDLELGGTLPNLEIAYETWGHANDDLSNCVMVVPAFSANCHARSSAPDESKGWWEHIIGPGLPIDTNKFFVVCASLLGGCHGTTGPLSLDRSSPPRAYQGDFPLVTIGDLARCHLQLLASLGVEKAHAICGGSMGAMQAIEMGIHHPQCAHRVIAISGTNQTRPATAAIRHLGRQSIMLDPNFKGGFYGDHGPEAGIKLAREIGTVFYRSKGEFNDRFSPDPINEPSLDGTTFDVQSYLAHQGTKMVGRFDANSYLRLSLAMDLHNVSRFEDHSNWHLRKKGPRFFIGGVKEDRLMTLDEQIDLHELLLRGGGHSHMQAFTSPVGHDAFLVQHQEIADFIARAL